MSGSASTTQGSSHGNILGQYLPSVLGHSLTRLKKIIGITSRRTKDAFWTRDMIRNRVLGCPSASQKKLVHNQGWPSLMGLKQHQRDLRSLEPYWDPKWWVCSFTIWHSGPVGRARSNPNLSSGSRPDNEWRIRLQIN